ncbi:MAG: alpha/beta hydrolase [Pseudomonadota bacterium]
MPSPEHEAVVKAIIESLRSVTATTLEEQRQAYDTRLGAHSIAEGVTSTPGMIDHIPIEWLEPENPKGTILHLHGGGYSSGSIVAFRAFCSSVAKHTQCRVCLVEYRLAPEQPFPAAVDDALLAYRWLLEHENLEPAEIAISGDSAGGGLALATLINAKRNLLPLPSCASVLSPWTDLSNGGETMPTGRIDDPILTKESADALAQLYCTPEELANPLVSPLHGDLEGLPPIQIQVGTRETLLDDSRRFATRARNAGVEVDQFEGEDLIHVWPLIAPHAPEAAEAFARMGAFVSKHIR